MSYRFLFTLLLVTTAITASAQDQDPVKTRSQFVTLGKISPLKLPGRSIKDTAINKRLIINYPIRKEWYHEGTLVDSSSVGKVYRMPVDKMLCVVPDAAKTSRMPVKQLIEPERMPNAFSRKGMGR